MVLNSVTVFNSKLALNKSQVQNLNLEGKDLHFQIRSGGPWVDHTGWTPRCRPTLIVIKIFKRQMRITMGWNPFWWSILIFTDYKHTMAKYLILCDPNGITVPKCVLINTYFHNILLPSLMYLVRIHMDENKIAFSKLISTHYAYCRAHCMPTLLTDILPPATLWAKNWIMIKIIV